MLMRNLSLWKWVQKDRLWGVSAKTYLMRPYSRPRNENLDDEKQIFNDRFSRVRMYIESAFYVLHQNIQLKWEIDISVIKCVCILHNLIAQYDWDSDSDYINKVEKMQNINLNTRISVQNNRASNRDIQIRNALKQHFVDEQNYCFEWEQCSQFTLFFYDLSFCEKYAFLIFLLSGLYFWNWYFLKVLLWTTHYD